MSIDQTIRIMLVDDHQTMLWGLDKLIEGEAGMQVVGTANDCATALARCAELRPDLIVLDLDLGGSSSIDILPQLLANGHTRALMFTGNRDQATLGSAVKNGARGVVGKDAPAPVLLQAIRKVHAGERWLDQAMLGSLLDGMFSAPPPPKADPEAPRIATLTAKERKIIAMVVAGNGALNKELAQRAFISEQTLRNHLTSIYQKLGVGNRLELYVYATKHQLGDAVA